MANHISAWKRIRQNSKRRARNVHFKTFMKNRVRKVREAISAGDSSVAREALKLAVSAITRVAAKGVIHRNTASRKVSRLSRAVSSMMAS